MRKKGKVTKRSSKKYPALDPTVNLLTRYDEITDIDYIDKLSHEEKLWLNNFLEEYVCANMKHKGTKLHTTKEQKKRCYDRNNARNRDIYSRVKSQGKLVTFSELTKKEDFYNFEDSIINRVDIKNGKS